MVEEHTGQVSTEAAEVYEAMVVPAVFGEWGPRVADAARIGPGQRVLDVACGTGVVAREAVRRVGPKGQVVGLDNNPGMLAVARRSAPGVEFRPGDASSLPFPDGHFDAVTCSFGLMYFPDQAKALGEACRVLKPGGRFAATVWDVLEHQKVESALVAVLAKRFGEAAASEFRHPMSMGDPVKLKALLAKAGMPDATITTVHGTAVGPSLPAYLEGLIRGWTLADKMNDDQIASLVAEVEPLARPHAKPRDGMVVMDAPAHVIAWTKR